MDNLDKVVLSCESIAYSTPIFFDSGGNMREVFGHGLFDLGSIWQIARLPVGPLTDESRLVIYHCINILRGVSNDKNNMKDMPHAIGHIDFIATKLENLLKDKEANITPEGRDIFIYDVSTLRTLLFSEMAKLSIILLEEKRGYSVTALWKNQFDLMPKGVNRYLSKFVKSNLIESAKCLVLNCYTAVGFHSMRSIEYVTRKYYELIKGIEPKKTDGSYKGLGTIAQELLDQNVSLKKEGKASDDLLVIASTIKGLCKKKRDPLAHPEIIALKEDEAMETFVDALQVISKVVIDAKTKGSHFVTPWKRGVLF
jgi:hypothetical protein